MFTKQNMYCNYARSLAANGGLFVVCSERVTSPIACLHHLLHVHVVVII